MFCACRSPLWLRLRRWSLCPQRSGCRSSAGISGDPEHSRARQARSPVPVVPVPCRSIAMSWQASQHTNNPSLLAESLFLLARAEHAEGPSKYIDATEHVSVCMRVRVAPVTTRTHTHCGPSSSDCSTSARASCPPIFRCLGSVTARCCCIVKKPPVDSMPPSNSSTRCLQSTPAMWTRCE